MKIVVIILNLFVIGFSQQRIQRVRVIGGYTENIERFPFTAAIVVKNIPETTEDAFAGGAVIISTVWAITAAHCVMDLLKDFIPQGNVVLRSNTTYWKGPRSQYSSDHIVVAGFIHNKYNPITDDYDAAALKVQHKFTAKHEVPATMLAGTGYKYVTGTAVIVLGWGTTNVSVEAFTVPHLRAVEVKIFDPERCVKAYSDINEVITPRMLCANAPGKDACINDSGGPLVQNNTVIGLVSWGIGCANDEFPGIYTRLSTVSEWITEIQKNK